MNGKRRVLATICSGFPIYSQTFVYQELKQLVEHGCDVRVIYSQLNSREQLSPQFAELWDLKRPLHINRAVHQRDFDRYRQSKPGKVDALIHSIAEASGMTMEAVASHDNVLQAFTFTRLAEAYCPDYLHSYFFYDRSLMALVAGELLDIPRGVTCYADHMLRDYDLKLVPLHLEQCDIVVATSHRIKDELLQIAPQAAPDRILVKPNGIDARNYECVERTEPNEEAPHRLVTVCRIEPKKGLLELVDAVHALRTRGVLVEAHIVGDVDEWSDAGREYKRKLDQKITELDLWGVVHLEGRHNSTGVARFLGIAHLFVAPFVEMATGDKDGIPTALLEGMATGLPVVATNAGSIAEVVIDGEHGLLVSQRNPAEMARAIELLLADSAHRRELGAAAARRVREHFDVAQCEAAFHARIDEVVVARNRSRGARSLPTDDRP